LRFKIGRFVQESCGNLGVRCCFSQPKQDRRLTHEVYSFPITLLSPWYPSAPTPLRASPGDRSGELCYKVNFILAGVQYYTDSSTDLNLTGPNAILKYFRSAQPQRWAFRFQCPLCCASRTQFGHRPRSEMWHEKLMFWSKPNQTRPLARPSDVARFIAQLNRINPPTAQARKPAVRKYATTFDMAAFQTRPLPKSNQATEVGNRPIPNRRS
jgi:hypothetical protein